MLLDLATLAFAFDLALALGSAAFSALRFSALTPHTMKAQRANVRSLLNFFQGMMNC